MYFSGDVVDDEVSDYPEGDSADSHSVPAADEFCARDSEEDQTQLGETEHTPNLSAASVAGDDALGVAVEVGGQGYKCEESISCEEKPAEFGQASNVLVCDNLLEDNSDEVCAVSVADLPDATDDCIASTADELLQDILSDEGVNKDCQKQSCVKQDLEVARVYCNETEANESCASTETTAETENSVQDVSAISCQFDGSGKCVESAELDSIRE